MQRFRSRRRTASQHYGETKLNDLTKNILLWVVIVLVMLAVFSRYMPSGPQRRAAHATPSSITDVHASKVDSVVLQGDTIRGVLKDKTAVRDL